jgi:predicted NAD/FAD-binding protein
MLRRRSLLAAAAAPLAACREAAPAWQGGWVGDAMALGHRLNERAEPATPAREQRVDLLILGAGIAGLAAARAARQAGVEQLAVIDLHASAGGNSRGHQIGGQPCPLGAHYLPLPGPLAHEVADWLHEIGVARQHLGRTVFDERHLCHSPQERLFLDGAWHEGVLPPAEPGSATHTQYRHFARRVAALRDTLGFAMPTRRAPWRAGHAALDALGFAEWLRTEGLDDARLRWYLDYCCRDDYGATAAEVSAWAGVHYFASRHGFFAPGDADEAPEPVLTWPEGNAWLVRHLTASLGDRLKLGRLATRVEERRHDVAIDVRQGDAVERWVAPQVVLALPLRIAARIVAAPHAALNTAAAALSLAPWLVANLALDRPLLDRGGAAPAWDNVSHGASGLGYVDAQHQGLAQRGGSTLITAYHALPAGERVALRDAPWRDWAERVVADLTTTHPDLPRRVQRIDLARHGHAMSVPRPGVRGHAALQALAEGRADTRLDFAHSDLAGYSVFEEAFTLGHAAGTRAARRLLAPDRSIKR